MISLVIGLGNPGDNYRGSRHNIGFEVINLAARILKAVSQPPQREYLWSVAERSGRRLILATPSTYMNRSGEAVHTILEDGHFGPDQALVVVDDFNLPLGAIRIRAAGSDGGHKGLASIINTLGINEFPRLRVGIGPPADDQSGTEFVLASFRPEELEKVRETIAKAAEAVIFAAEHRLEMAMAKYNFNPAPPESL